MTTEKKRPRRLNEIGKWVFNQVGGKKVPY